MILLPLTQSRSFGQLHEADSAESILLTSVGAYGCAVYGPYTQLAPGRYTAEFDINLAEGKLGEAEEACGYVDVAVNNGQKVIARANFFRHRLARSSKIQLQFHLVDSGVVETRVHTNGAHKLAIGLHIKIYSSDDQECKLDLMNPLQHLDDQFVRTNISRLQNLYDKGVDVNASPEGTLLRHRGVSIWARSEGDIGVFDGIFCGNDYQIETREQLTFIDIGMNVGIASLFAARMPNVIEIHGFEPFPATYERALENFKLNPTIASKILANNIGLSDHAFDAEVQADEDANVAVSINGLKAGGRKTKIKISDTGAILEPIVSRALNEGRQVFAKIDCEGSEFAIFESLSRSGLLEKFRGLLVEWHKWWDGERTQRQLISLLTPLNYVVLDRTTMHDIWAGRFDAIRVDK